MLATASSGVNARARAPPMLPDPILPMLYFVGDRGRSSTFDSLAFQNVAA